jgi:subtilisin family serine protease
MQSVIGPRLVLLFLFLTGGLLKAQIETGPVKLYWVSFTDKGVLATSPAAFFDSKALERRAAGNIPFDYSDYPVSVSYLNGIENHVTELIGYSKWFNACAISATREQIQQIGTFVFVKKIQEVEINQSLSAVEEICGKETNGPTTGRIFSANEKKIIRAQQESMGLSAWQKKGIAGKGIRIAVFDAGFPNVDKHPCFEHIRQGNRIIATRNFLNKSTDVYGRNFHGEAVLSCIAGIQDTTQLGVGSEAEFLLAITEYGMREPFREEVFWLMAAEWADEKGAHIISSSLGYGYQRYFLKDMDGKTSLVAKAAAKAVSKGILVINSAGNEGTDPWKLIITPADQDSVLAVGGVDPRSGYHIDFSSYGPNYLGHVKPNLCAPGDVMAARGMKIGNIQGTSFSCPLMAGFAACLLQFKPELIGKPIQSMRFLEEHSSLYPYFDYAHGYGVPDVNYILEGKRNTGNAALSLKDEGAKKSINIHFEETSADPYLINEWKHSLYVKFLDENGKVISYQLYEVKSDMKEIDVSYQRVENVFAVEAHYAGVTKKLILNHYAH